LELGRERHELGDSRVGVNDPGSHEIAKSVLHRCASFFVEERHQLGDLLEGKSEAFRPGDEQQHLDVAVVVAAVSGRCPVRAHQTRLLGEAERRRREPGAL
jgi:hypothetical protein